MANFWVLTSYIVISIVGFWLMRLMFPRLARGVLWSCSAPLGIAVVLVASYLCFKFQFANAVFVGMMLVTLLGAWVGWLVRSRKYPCTKPLSQAFIVVVALVGLSRYLCAWQHDLPLGWDPTFHLILARKILTLQSLIHDWLPFRPITLNYPIGPHQLLARLSLLSGIPTSAWFNGLIPFLGVVQCVQVYAMLTTAKESRETAVLGSFAFGMLALFGSIDYYRWGGLPNQLGMTFLYASLQLVFVAAEEERTRIRNGLVLLSALFLGIIPITHHHVMISAGVIFGISALALLMADETRAFRTILIVSVFSVLISSPALLDYLRRSGTVGNTGIFQFSEDVSNPLYIPANLGYAFTFLCVTGSVLLWRCNKKRSRSSLSRVFVWNAAGLFGLFVLLGYVAPRITNILWGQTISPFTPSRFLTNAVFFLALPAGVSLAWLHKKLIIHPMKFYAILAILVLTNKDQWRELYIRTPVYPDQKIAYVWIRDHAAEQVVLCNQERYWGVRGSWATFLTWHRTGHTSIPISEPVTDGPTLEQALESYCQNGTTSPLLEGLQVWDVVRSKDLSPDVSPDAVQFALDDRIVVFKR